MSEPTTEIMPRVGRGTEADTEAGRSRAVRWSEAGERFAGGGWYWLTTTSADGRPHVVPVFAAWHGSGFYVASNPGTRKSRDLAATGRAVVSKDAGDLHLVVEGEAARVTEPAALARVCETFRSVYDWPVTVAGTRLDAPFGAPTSGGPPYDAWEITPTRAFGLPSDGETFAPTRWRFGR